MSTVGYIDILLLNEFAICREMAKVPDPKYSRTFFIAITKYLKLHML